MFFRGLFIICIEILVEKRADAGHLHQGPGPFLLGHDNINQPGILSGINALITHVGTQKMCDTGRIIAFNIMLVEPQQLIGIKCRCGPVHLCDIKQLDHFIEREYLLITMGPSQPHQVVQ